MALDRATDGNGLRTDNSGVDTMDRDAAGSVE